MKTVPIPRVVTEHERVPFWARLAVGRIRRKLAYPDGLLAVRVTYPYQSLWSVEWPWRSIRFTLDRDEIGTLPTADGRVTFAAPLSDGRHALGVELADGSEALAAVTLEVRRGMIILLDLTPETRPWAGGRNPSLNYKILPSGFVCQRRSKSRPFRR